VPRGLPFSVSRPCEAAFPRVGEGIFLVTHHDLIDRHPGEGDGTCQIENLVSKSFFNRLWVVPLVKRLTERSASGFAPFSAHALGATRPFVAWQPVLCLDTNSDQCRSVKKTKFGLAMKKRKTLTTFEVPVRGSHSLLVRWA
jgi:hypothetical protein